MFKSVFELSSLLILLNLAMPSKAGPMPMAMPMAMPMPMPQSQDENGYDTSTEKCDEVAFEAYVQKQARCFQEADSLVNVAAATGNDIVRAICDSTEANVKCINDGALDCYDQTVRDKFVYNTLLEAMRKAANTTSLGQNFIDACPVLAENEAFVVQRITGSSKCSFSEWFDQGEQVSQCFRQAFVKNSDAIPLSQFVSDKVSYFFGIECTLYEDLRLCRRIHLDGCYTEAGGATALANDKEFFQNREKELQDVFTGFSYATNC